MPGAARFLAGLVVVLLEMNAPAQAFQVQPVRLELPAERAQGVLTVHNPTAAPLLIQAEVFDWQQADGSDVLTPTRNVLVNPPIFEIAPGASQLVRVGLRPDAKPIAGRESSYRVWLSQLPRANDAPGNGVKILFRLNLPLFVAARDARPAEAVWRHDADALRLTNLGTRHLALREVVLTREDGTTLKLPHRTVLAGADAHWPLPPDWRDAAFAVKALAADGALLATPALAGR